MPQKQQPWWKAFVKDILADPQLKSLPLETRGFWLYLMCLMHKSPRRGYLLQENGTPYLPEQLAQIAGCSTDKAAHLYQSLIDSAVFSVSDGGLCVYSRRMVRETRLAELRANAGSKGGFAKAKRLAKPQQKVGNSVGDCIKESNSTFFEDEEKQLRVGMVRTEFEKPEVLRPQNPIDSELSPTWLARNWVMIRGKAGTRDELERAAATFADMIDNGCQAQAIMDEIHSKRRKSEPIWDLDKRLMDRLGLSGKRKQVESKDETYEQRVERQSQQVMDLIKKQEMESQ